MPSGSRAVVSVVGRDQKGVVARISTYLASCDINIEDIEQRVMEGLFIMTMQVDLAELSASLDELALGLRRIGDEPLRYAADLDASWASLRGVHGGYCSALLVRAAEATFPDRAVRTVAASFLRPTEVGPAEIDLDIVRAGRSVTLVSQPDGQRFVIRLVAVG